MPLLRNSAPRGPTAVLHFAMPRLLSALGLAAVLLTPSLALADVPPLGGCNRCSVEDEPEGAMGLALVALVGGLAGLSLRRRED